MFQRLIRPQSVAITLAAVVVAVLMGGVLGVVWADRTDFWQKFRLDSGTPTVLLADGGSALSSLIYVGYQKTHFLSNGVNLHLTPYRSGRDALKAMINGHADMAAVADTPLSQAMLDLEDFKIIATIGTSGHGCGIVADRKIASPAQLAGKKVGYIPGTSSEYFLSQVLLHHDVDQDSVALVPIEAEEAQFALKGGEIDAVSLYDPYIAKIQIALGDQVMVFSEPELYNFPWNIVASRRLLRSPATIEKVLMALFAAESFVHSNPEDSKEIAARFLRVSSKAMDQIWPTLDFNITLNQSLVITLERQISLRRGNKEPKKDPNALNFIYFDAMAKVMPERMTIIR